MNSYTVNEVQSQLPQILAESSNQEPVVISQNAEPVALLLPLPDRKLPVSPAVVVLLDPVSWKIVWPEQQTPRTPSFGSCQGMLKVLAEDDDHLKDFAEYMK